MASFSAGEVVLLVFPFTDGGTAKRRPALVLLDTGDSDVVVVRITSQTGTTAADVALDGWRRAGLLIPSTVRLHKVATLQKSLVERKLGRLDARDWSRVVVALRGLCQTL